MGGLKINTNTEVLKADGSVICLLYTSFACTLASTVMEWLTAKLLERLHRRKWWDYSGKRFNLNGYVCLQYSCLLYTSRCV